MDLFFSQPATFHRSCFSTALVSPVPPLISATHIFHPPIDLQRSFSSYPSSYLLVRSVRCFDASSRRSPPEPKPESLDRDDSSPSTGLAASFSKSQDSARIFCAVFFWLSLFFWASAWDGRNNGRPNNGSQFRK